MSHLTVNGKIAGISPGGSLEHCSTFRSSTGLKIGTRRRSFGGQKRAAGGRVAGEGRARQSSRSETIEPTETIEKVKAYQENRVVSRQSGSRFSVGSCRMEIGGMWWCFYPLTVRLPPRSAPGKPRNSMKSRSEGMNFCVRNFKMKKPDVLSPSHRAFSRWPRVLTPTAKLYFRISFSEFVRGLERRPRQDEPQSPQVSNDIRFSIKQRSCHSPVECLKPRKPLIFNRGCFRCPPPALQIGRCLARFRADALTKTSARQFYCRIGCPPPRLWSAVWV